MKIKGIWIVLALIFILFISQYQNLLAAFPYQPTLGKCIGQSGTLTCSPIDYTPVTIPGVVAISDFWYADEQSDFVGCSSPNIPSSECWGGYTIISFADIINGWGCNESTYTYDCVTQDWGTERRTKTFGIPKFRNELAPASGCTAGLKIALPNGSSYWWNAYPSFSSGQKRDAWTYTSWADCMASPAYCYPPSRSGTFEGNTVRIVQTGYNWDFHCIGATWGITPKTFALDIVYDKTPTQVIVGTTSYIKAYITSNTTSSVIVKLNGQWSYLTPWGQRTETYSTDYITLQPNVNTSINIPVPTDYLFVLTFSFKTIDVQYSIEHLTGGSGTLTLSLPTNEVTIIPEPMICYSDSDCVPPCSGKVGKCGADNHCYFTGECITGPGGTFNWSLLANIWDSFVQWVKGTLNWQ